MKIVIVCIGVSTPLKNTTPLFFAKPPFLGNLPLYWFPRPLKVASPPSVNPQNINFSSLTPTYISKVTKFLVKDS